jgi:uncharacterized protein YdhG (YjbR/CyaY superfamily)
MTEHRKPKGGSVFVSKSTESKSGSKKKNEGFSAEERAAMKERAKEQKAALSRAEAEADVLAKIAEMQERDRVMAERIHAIVKVHAPSLAPKTWYGMPAYATADGKIVCFFQSAQKFNTRYATLGFNESAALDDGDFWPVAYALMAMTPAVEERIATLVKQAVS